MGKRKSVHGFPGPADREPVWRALLPAVVRKPPRLTEERRAAGGE